MATALGVVALIAVAVTLASLLVTIWTEQQPKTEQLLKLLQQLLSWQVIAGGLAVGGGAAFHDEIAGALSRLF
ncbi:MAG: hypothetical protein QF664_13720 [Dehalococcoidia bacterium]|jgi:hypothetical protein|nr:hypothetical protein [Dehalococcoidia bacterium]